MAPLMLLAFAILLLVLLFKPDQVRSLSSDGHILLSMKEALTDDQNMLRDWTASSLSPCSWTGVLCDGTMSVIALNFSNFYLKGPIPTRMCQIGSLTDLNFYYNDFRGSFPDELLTCSQVTSLNLSENWIVGSLPERIDQMKALQFLDLSNNNISGPIPESFGRLPELVHLGLQNNVLNGTIPSFLGRLRQLQYLGLAWNSFSPGPIPSELGNLSELTYLWLTSCSLTGTIPEGLGNLTKLNTFDVARNSLTGPIPGGIMSIRSLVQLELYQNLLSGPIPDNFGDLTELARVDMSSNNLSGPFPSNISGMKCLNSLHLYRNRLSGDLPDEFGDLPVVDLEIFNNEFTGHFPQAFGSYSQLASFDISYNHFSGPLPPHLCHGSALWVLDTIHNNFIGTIPQSYGACRTLVRLRLSSNQLSGTVPTNLWGLPVLDILDLRNNRLEGSLPAEIGQVRNVSVITISFNRLSGPIPKEVGNLSHLSTLSLECNQIFGEVPSAIGNCHRIDLLNLSHNQLTGPIPPSIGQLSSLNYLDLSSNKLSGEIPQSLGNLRLAAFNASDNSLQGAVPSNLIDSVFFSGFVGNQGLCGNNFLGLKACGEKISSKLLIKVILVGTFSAAFLVLVLGLVCFYKRYRQHIAKLAGYDNERSLSWIPISFHKLRFSEREIVGRSFDKEDVLGCGGCGKVYKITLGNGDTVAVKQIRVEVKGDQSGRDGGFKAEVETLGKIRHKNIVKLLCCCRSNKDTNLLVYEYMENGSLKDALHGPKSGMLDWPTRYRIAVGSARGLSYLHHDCNPPIVHRDVKSGNILLDSDYEARIADFGLARIVENVQGFTTDIMGTPGYIAPEHGHSRKVTEKSDIYSFGVVLLELVTGKHPVAQEFEADGADHIVKWVNNKSRTSVLDPSCLPGSFSKEEMLLVLEVALQCTDPRPSQRPTMREVVKMLTKSMLRSSSFEDPTMHLFASYVMTV